LESFSYELQFDMHFYMHSYLHKIFILVKSGCYSMHEDSENGRHQAAGEGQEKTR
jgi:hypothetical protein